MNTKSDANVRRSNRLGMRRRQNKINYKEIEEGKEFVVDEDSIDNAVHKDYEKEVLSKIKTKGDMKLTHPKKSLTAYTLFVKLKRKELQEKYPDATTPELMKEIGRQWKSINDKDKAWYQNMASKDKERYRREMEQMNKLKEFHKLDNWELKRPKKCLSSYMIFVRETRAKVTQEFPDMNALDVMKEVGRRWQSILPENKSYFQALADKDKDRFKKENQQYMKELEQLDIKLKSSNKGFGEIGDEQKFDDDIGEIASRSHDSSSKIGANGKRMRRDPHMPKKPLSAYIYFSQETREKIKKDNPKMPVASIMKEVSNRWNSMTKQEREPYVSAAKEDKQRYEKEISELKQNKNLNRNFEQELSPSIQKLEDENQYVDVEDSEINKDYRHTQQQKSHSKADKQIKQTNKPTKSDNKVQINLSELNSSKKQPEPVPKMEIAQPKPKSSPESQFRFNLPESKNMVNMDQTPPIQYRKDMSNAGGNNYHDSISGSTDNNQGNAFMYRPNMFSPSPFGQNRSPGVSPNMVPMYSPMLMRGNDSYRDYSNRNAVNLNRSPSIMGQTPTMNVNRNEYGYNEYNVIGMSPGGFTPMRHNPQKGNPMFSPAQNVGGSGLFGPSPSMNNLSYQPFGGYGRTPVNQYAGNAQRFVARPMNPSESQAQDSKRPDQSGSGLFDLNPFG